MPPVVIGAGIAAAGTIGGALISSHSQSSAAKTAANAQQQATNTQLQLGQQQLDQARSIYNSNYNLMSPFVSRGNVAGDRINALLNLPAAPKISSPLTGTQTAPVVAQVPYTQPNTLLQQYGGAI